MGPFIAFLKEDINRFISDKIGVESTYVVGANLNNIIDNRVEAADKKIIISIVSIEEDKMLKTPDNYIRSETEIIRRKPPVWLNMICLFTFYTRSSEDYEGLEMLENVVQYFQSRPCIDETTVMNFPPGLGAVRSEFISLNYEQANDLWGLFGSKYHPSVLYKFKSFKVDNAALTPGGPPVKDIRVKAMRKK